MKSYSNLFEKICAFENLYLASKKAEKGKRFRDEVARFNARRAENLLEMERLLRAGTYPFGRFHTFRIFHPKPRMISAAPYADRVVHHALMNVIGPLFERTFIHDSYANQKNKGTHAARPLYPVRPVLSLRSANGYSKVLPEYRSRYSAG